MYQIIEINTIGRVYKTAYCLKTLSRVIESL